MALVEMRSIDKSSVRNVKKWDKTVKKHFERSWDRQKNLDSISGLPASFFDSLFEYLFKPKPETDQESPQGVSASLTHDLLPPQDLTVSEPVLPTSTSPPADSDSRQHELSTSVTHAEPLLPPLRDLMVSEPMLSTSTSPADSQSDLRPHELSVTEQDTIMPSPNDDSEDTNA